MGEVHMKLANLCKLLQKVSWKWSDPKVTQKVTPSVIWFMRNGNTWNLLEVRTDCYCTIAVQPCKGSSVAQWDKMISLHGVFFFMNGSAIHITTCPWALGHIVSFWDMCSCLVICVVVEKSGLNCCHSTVLSDCLEMELEVEIYFWWKVSCCSKANYNIT